MTRNVCLILMEITGFFRSVKERLLSKQSTHDSKKRTGISIGFIFALKKLVRPFAIAETRAYRSRAIIPLNHLARQTKILTCEKYILRNDPPPVSFYAKIYKIRQYSIL